MRRFALLLNLTLSGMVFTLHAVTTLDLTTTGATVTATASVGGNFIVQQINPQSTGTGLIDSFLRVQSNGNEQGFNTSLSTPLDDKGGGFTRALTLGEVPIVTIGSTSYRQFLLDINQTNSGTNRLLNLNQIQIFTRAGDTDQFTPSNPSLTASPFINITGATQVFAMNLAASFDRTILMDFNLNPGSGAGDMFLFVPNSDFTGLPNTQNVILFSQFGTPPGANDTNDGIEEWAVLTSTCVGTQCGPQVPEPSSVLLFSTVLLVVFRFSRKFRAA